MVASSPTHSRPIVRLLVATSLFWASLYVYYPVLAVRAQNLGASMALIGMIVGAYGFTQLLLRIPIGVLSDRMGARKPFIMAGLVATGLAGLGLGACTDPRWLVVFRGASGVGAAAWVVFTVLYAGYWEPHRVTRAVSQVTFVGALAEMLSGLVGGMIAERWGWEAPFYVAVVLALAGLLVVFPLKEMPIAARHSVKAGQFLRIATMPTLLVVSLIAMITSWAQWATAFGFTPIYAASLGATRADLGLLTAASQFGFVVFTFAAAYSVDWIGVRSTVIVGVIVQVVSAWMLPAAENLWLVGVSQLLNGVGRGLSRTVLMGLSIQHVASADRATAMGVYQAVYALGMFAGPASTGLLADSFGISSVFLVAGAVCAVGLGLSAWKVPVK